MAKSMAGVGQTTQQSAPVPGSLFGVPKYSTQPRFVPDAQNELFAVPQNKGSSAKAATTKLDQLDVVVGWKLYIDLVDVWDQGAGETLTASPFYPATLVESINVKLQAAYDSFNLPGFLASIIQAYRPMWGNRGVGTIVPDVFANPSNATAPDLVGGDPTPISLAIDIPVAFRFDEYFDLTAQGDPVAKYGDAIVNPYFMAGQARVVVPTIVMAQTVSTDDLLGAPVTSNGAGTPGTFSQTSGEGRLLRDAFWSAQNPAANPPQYPWMYTRDYFTQPTSGQNQVSVLIQNTGVSVGQVMSLFGIVWDPEADSGNGAIVPFSDIESFQIVTGGSLQNISMPPEALTDRMRSLYGNVPSDFPDGVFVFDFALSEDGSYISNAKCINTYLVNGVSLIIKFRSGSAPSSSATVYLGVEALKLATS